MTKYYASNEAAIKYAKLHNGKVSKCIIVREDGTPVQDMDENIEIYKVVTDSEDTGVFGIGLYVQEA